MNYELEHTLDGMCEPGQDYNEEKFELSIPSILKVLARLEKLNITPRVGEGITTDDDCGGDCYIITKIIYDADNDIRIFLNDKY